MVLRIRRALIWRETMRTRHSENTDDDSQPPVTDETVAPAPEEVTPTREELLKAELAEEKDKYLRLSADFDNFRKRSARDAESRATRAKEALACEILEVVDNLERALAVEDEGSLQEGLQQIHKLTSRILENHGITPIEALNSPFDPRHHEALAHVPSEAEEGIVIDEITKGYRMGENVIRCSRVAVSCGNGKTEQTSESSEEEKKESEKSNQ